MIAAVKASILAWLHYYRLRITLMYGYPDKVLLLLQYFISFEQLDETFVKDLLS